MTERRLSIITAAPTPVPCQQRGTEHDATRRCIPAGQWPNAEEVCRAIRTHCNTSFTDPSRVDGCTIYWHDVSNAHQGQLPPPGRFPSPAENLPPRCPTPRR